MSGNLCKVCHRSNLSNNTFGLVFDLVSMLFDLAEELLILVGPGELSVTDRHEVFVIGPVSLSLCFVFETCALVEYGGVCVFVGVELEDYLVEKLLLLFSQVHIAHDFYYSRVSIYLALILDTWL